MNPLTERFLGALKPEHGDETENSVYHRAAKKTSAVLVVNEDEDASSLVTACFEHRFPVAVELVRHDPCVPRIEMTSRRIVGEQEILNFLVNRD